MSAQPSNAEHVSLLEEKHQSMIQNIRELQDLEKYMYDNLARLSSQEGTQNQEDQIIQRIQELKQMRVNLFSQLKDKYSDASTDLNESRRSLRDQLMATKMVEEELEQTKKNYDTLVQNKNNKIRMVQIGDYETQRFNANIGVLKTLSISAAIVIVISILYHRDIIPGSISSMLIIAVLSVGGIMAVRDILDILSRSRFVFDQYEWTTNHKSLEAKPQDLILSEKISSASAPSINVTMTQSVSEPTDVQPAESSTQEGFCLYHS